MSPAIIRVGTRGSALAMAQTRQIADRIAKVAKAEIELVPITTHGDTSRASLADIGGTGVFAAALREALLAGECDFVVHSLKDLPTADRPALTSLGPWYDVCRPGCCENVRAGFKPAIAGIVP